MNNALNNKIEELHLREKLLTKERLIKDIKKTENEESSIITFLIFLILIGLCVYGLLVIKSYAFIFILGTLIALAFIYPVIKERINIKTIIKGVKNDNFIIKKDIVISVTRLQNDNHKKEFKVKFKYDGGIIIVDDDKDIMFNENDIVYLVSVIDYMDPVKVYNIKNVIIDDSLNKFIQEDNYNEL